MELTFLTQIGSILGPFAWVMGTILNGIYEVLSFLGIGNMAIGIVLFTFVIKMMMLPLTMKQQKGQRLTTKMQPEIQKVQAKYKGKKDQESMRKQQAEMSEIYSKYGTSPLSGCLPLLISLPIMFALYRVIYAIPAYVNDVKDLYYIVAQGVSQVEGYANAVIGFVKDQGINASTKGLLNFETYGQVAEAQIKLIDIFSAFKTVHWDKFLNIETWNIIGEGETAVQYFTANNLALFKDIIEGTTPVIREGIAQTSVPEAVDKILHVNRFIGTLNILDEPGFAFPGIIIPIAAAGSQFAQTKLMMAANVNTKTNSDTAGQSMKAMNNVMPVVSGVFCTFMPIGVGIYWIAGSVVQIGQQLFINKYLDKVSVDEIIEQNVAKSNKKKEKMGVATGNRMANVAKTTTKSIEASSTSTTMQANKQSTKARTESSYNKSNTSYAAGSIAANANILKRNSDKGEKK